MAMADLSDRLAKPIRDTWKDKPLEKQNDEAENDLKRFMPSFRDSEGASLAQKCLKRIEQDDDVSLERAAQIEKSASFIINNQVT